MSVQDISSMRICKSYKKNKAAFTDWKKVKIPSNTHNEIALGFVYILLDQDQIVYVGSTSKNVFLRIGSHLSNKKFDSFIFNPFPIDEIELKEFSYIAKFKPKYNQQIPNKCGYTSLDCYIQRSTMKGHARKARKLIEKMDLPDFNGYYHVNDLKKLEEQFNVCGGVA